MDDARQRIRPTIHSTMKVVTQDRLLEEVARKSADWQGASDEVMATLRGLFDELRKALPRKQIALRDGNNIDGLRSQLSSASRKVKDAIEALSRDEAIKPAPNVSSEAIHVVFISSTFEDLREERAAVQKAVLQLGCLPIGMELFPSDGEAMRGVHQGRNRAIRLVCSDRRQSVWICGPGRGQFYREGIPSRKRTQQAISGVRAGQGSVNRR